MTTETEVRAMITTIAGRLTEMAYEGVIENIAVIVITTEGPVQFLVAVNPDDILEMIGGAAVLQSSLLSRTGMVST